MGKVERDLQRILNLLRHCIRERGFTQMEVQEALGWGRSYISQLLTEQKSLRMDQVLQVLNVIGVKPEDFWGELYQFGGPYAAEARRSASPASRYDAPEASLYEELASLQALTRGVVTALEKKSLISLADLEPAVAKARLLSGNGRR